MEASVMSCVRIGSWHHIIHTISVVIYSIWQSITGTTVAPDVDGGYHNYLEGCFCILEDMDELKGGATLEHCSAELFQSKSGSSSSTLDWVS